VTPVPVDLARDLEAALDGPVELVTTSALLDLVSHEWLDRLVTEAAARRLPVYAALSYDGLATLDPGRHARRRRDRRGQPAPARRQGIRSGARPEAAATAPSRFEAVGYRVTQGSSDWVFGPRDAEIQTEVLTGWAVAAREIGESSIGDIIAGWHAGATTSLPGVRRCGSVTSTFSPGRWRRAEPTDRSRATLPRRSGAPASARAAPGRR
jgi:hypothetical protein